ncbi:hypothetical protein DV738_g1742, partial [Chaetothyriales sp. CBS 135597]
MSSSCNLDNEGFYRYSGGRWLWDEEKQLQARYRRFNVPELKHMAVKSVGAQACVSMMKLAEGGFNKVFRLVMDDDSVVIARIPNPNAGPAFRTTASEVATMDFARTILKIPVPKVLAWSGHSKNPVESEYILMEEAPGTPLHEVWGGLELHDKLKIVDDIVGIEKKLLSISFTRYGNLYYATDAFPGCEKAEIVSSASQSQREESEKRFVIGPVVDTHFWDQGRAAMDIDRGPWKSPTDYLKAICLREISWIRQYAIPKPSHSHGLFSVSTAQNTPSCHIALYEKLLAISDSLLLEKQELIRSTLWHWDIHAPNLFIDDGKVTSLIDWQDAWAGPLLLQARQPRLIRYNGESMLKLPEHYDTLVDKEGKARIRAQVEKSLALWVYESETKKSNPILYELSHLPQWRTMRDTVEFASNTHWDEINSRIPCPISFTDEELETHYRDGEGWNEQAEFWDSLEGLVHRDGWTSNETYNQALQAASAVAADSRYEDAHVVGGNRDTAADAQALRDVFNKQAFWRDFSKSSKKASGLIGNKYLTTADGFQKFAETSLAQCRKLVDRTLRASSQEEYVAIPKDLDRLSDLLCRVIDLSDFIRSNHPDSRVASAAHTSYSMMFQYMNELNTTTGLNSQLQKAWDTPEIRSQWNAEEEIVAKILMKDFAKSGIDLPGKQRDEFVRLSSEIAQVGTDFTSEMEPARGQVSVSQDRLNGLDPTYVRTTSRWRKTPVPIYSSLSRMIMQGAHDSSLRRELYVAERTASKRTIDRLESLLIKRAQLARLTGYSSYAEMTLADKMSQSPKAVGNFLESLLKSNKGQIQTEISRLLEMKRNLDQGAQEVYPWDHSYLLSKLYQARSRTSFTPSKSRLYESARSYFALGHVMQGLSSLFNALYGLRLVPKETQLGETWHPEVRRLDVYDSNNRHIATMYCDLFSRPGKPPNPAHFTLVCSREISEEEVQEDVAHGSPLNNGMAVLTETDSVTGRVRNFQIPIIALVCDFPDGHGSSSQPALLSISSVVTLFHEMGHAVHSFLGRTSLQGIAGTRCATDFAELPSILMEYFAMDPNVLKLFARHWQTDSLIPDELIRGLKDEAKARAEMSGGWENENQILMAMLDQVYHTDGPMSKLDTGKYNSTTAYHEVWDQHASCREPPETAWQGFFGHLYGYGSTYYAYLFDRAIARQVWRSVFRDGNDAGAVDRAAGERFRDEVLRHGGGKDPWKCLEGLMGEGRGILAAGGEPAMLEVGKWGIDASTEGQMKKKRCHHTFTRPPDQQAEVDGLERVLPNLVHKEAIRFVGDTNPESILADLSSRSKGSPRISRIGTWVERQKGPNIANDEVINAQFEERPPPAPKSGEKTPTNVEKYGKGEGGRRTLPAHYRNYLQSVGAFRVLPKATQDALITTYIACIDGILPVLDGGKLLRDYTAGRASIFLIQAVCLVTCKIPEVSGFLRLYENGPLLDPIPFARSLQTGLEAAMKADLEIDRVTKIQILTLMHLHNDGPGGIEESSLHLSHAIHDAWTSGLHIHTPGRTTKDHLSMLWWTIWALDKINACIGGRPIMIADRDIDIARPPLESSPRSAVITVWIRLGDLLDTTIDYYRPTCDADATGCESDFPSWDSLLQGVETDTFLDSHLKILELCYNVIAILSCRNSSPNTVSYNRRITASDRIESLLSNPPDQYLNIPPLPLVPYAVSLSLTVAYRRLRDNHYHNDPEQIQSALTVRCEMLENLSTYWWTAHGMAQLGRKALRSMQNPAGVRRSDIEGTAHTMDADVTPCKYGPFERKSQKNDQDESQSGNALHLLSDAAVSHATSNTTAASGAAAFSGVTTGAISLTSPPLLPVSTPIPTDFDKFGVSTAYDSQMFTDLDNMFDGFFDLSIPTITFNPNPGYDDSSGGALSNGYSDFAALAQAGFEVEAQDQSQDHEGHGAGPSSTYPEIMPNYEVDTTMTHVAQPSHLAAAVISVFGQPRLSSAKDRRGTVPDTELNTTALKENVRQHLKACLGIESGHFVYGSGIGRDCFELPLRNVPKEFVAQPPSAHDLAAQHRQWAKSPVWKLLSACQRQLGIHKIKRLIAEVMNGLLPEYVRWAYQGCYRPDVISHLGFWVRHVFAGLINFTLNVLDGQTQSPAAGDVLKWEEIALTRLGELRVEELYDIVNNLRAASYGIEDLRHFITSPATRSYLTSHFIQTLTKRLLHPAASTVAILRSYISIIRAFRLLEPKGVLLDRVAKPIRRYLRERDDTIKVIVNGLLSDSAEHARHPTAAAPASHHPAAADSVLSELSTELLNRSDIVAGITDDELDWDNMEWMPDPVDAAPDYTKSQHTDVIRGLTSLFDSKEVFVKELQNALAERLLKNKTDFNFEIKTIWFLQFVLGETALQGCEVMLRDVLDSDKLNAKILSRLFWPSMPEQGFTLPAIIRQQQQDYEAGFEAVKSSRKLTWVPAVGHVEVELHFADGRVFADTVLPYQATQAAKQAEEEERKQKMAMYHQFIVSMLTNAGAMQLPRISMMLGMVVPGGFPFSNDELKDFMSGMAKEGVLEVGPGGNWKVAS